MNIGWEILPGFELFKITHTRDEPFKQGIISQKTL